MEIKRMSKRIRTKDRDHDDYDLSVRYLYKVGRYKYLTLSEARAKLAKYKIVSRQLFSNESLINY